MMELKNILSVLSHSITGSLDATFYKLGLLVGTYPFSTIVGCLLLTAGICVPGLSKFHSLDNPIIAWGADPDGMIEEKLAFQHSYFSERSERGKRELAADMSFLDDVASDDVPAPKLPPRRIFMIIEADENALSTTFLNGLKQLDNTIKSHVSGNGFRYQDFCIKLPEDNETCDVNKEITITRFLGKTLTETLIDSTNEQLLGHINQLDRQSEFQLEYLFGGLARNDSEHLVGAEAALSIYEIQRLDQTVGAFNTGPAKDDKIDPWEEELVEIFSTTKFDGIRRIYIFGDTISNNDGTSAIFGDVSILVAGYCLVFCYICISLGKLNCVENKVVLAVVGIVTILLGLVNGYALASLFGYSYTTLNNIMPCLVLGIGIDDMFVIVQSFHTLSPEEKKETLAVQTALALKHSGVLITVTTVSDLAAILIGLSTPYESVRSFCVFASLCLLSVYCLVSTLFTACTRLDLQRASKLHNAILVCYKHKGETYKPYECSNTILIEEVFTWYGKLIAQDIVKYLILFISVVLLTFGIYGCVNLETKMDTSTFYKRGSMAQAFMVSEERWFRGLQARDIYQYISIGPENLYKNQHLLLEISKDLRNTRLINANETYCWFEEYKNWLLTASDTSSCNSKILQPENGEEENAEKMFSWCLFYYQRRVMDENGHRNFIVFNNDKTGVLASTVCAVRLNRNEEQVEARATQYIQQMLVDIRAKGFPTAFQQIHGFDSIRYGLQMVSTSLMRNTVLAIAMILLCCLLLTANLWISLLVGSSVILSTVDLAGFLQFWGLYVDGTFTLLMIIGIGLIVDYSVHIGQSFIHATGTQSERVQYALLKVGPAVWHGGFSTFMAFSALIFAKHGLFIIFFKIFFLMVLFGMFHGLVYLPVILMLIGGHSKSSHRKEKPKPQDIYTLSGDKMQQLGLQNKGLEAEEYPYEHHIALPKLEEIKQDQSALTCGPAGHHEWKWPMSTDSGSKGALVYAMADGVSSDLGSNSTDNVTLDWEDNHQPQQHCTHKEDFDGPPHYDIYYLPRLVINKNPK